MVTGEEAACVVANVVTFAVVVGAKILAEGVTLVTAPPLLLRVWKRLVKGLAVAALRGVTEVLCGRIAGRVVCG
jgi:hypothetical protein